jgi:hypothetical protein
MEIRNRKVKTPWHWWKRKLFVGVLAEPTFLLVHVHVNELVSMTLWRQFYGMMQGIQRVSW